MKEIILTKKEIEDLNRKKEELDIQQKQLEEKILQLEEEKQRLHDNTVKSIEDACNGKFFCGTILTAHDISAIVRLAIETKEPIRIAFRLYPIDDSETNPEAQSEPDQEPSEQKTDVVPLPKPPEPPEENNNNQ